MGSAREALRQGQAALSHGDWAAARVFFTDALDREAGPEAQHGLARAVEWSGDYEAAIRLYELAYAGFRARGESRRPALIASRELGFLYAAVYGDMAVAGGWMARGLHLAAAAGNCLERGWVALAQALMTEDPEERDGHLRAASDIARRFADADLRFCVMAYEGLSLVLRGRVTEGMRLVDEAAAAARGGEVSDYLAVGEIYCKMLVACELVLDVDRARQWMDLASAFGRDANALWVSAICRMHYGGILTAAGRWTEAEHELSKALQLYDTGYRALRAGAIVRLADLRARQGRFEEAARLLTGFEHDSYAVRPLARLHLARGDLEVAATTLHRSLGAADRGVLHAPELALLAEVEVAAGHLAEARTLQSRLRVLAAETDLAHVRGLSEYVAGVVCSAAEEPGAVAHLETALAAFAAAGLPLEEARTRLEIARTLALSSPQVAIAEAKAAFSMVQRLDARPEADAAASLLRSLGSTGGVAAGGHGTLTRRESEILALVVEGLSNEQVARRLFISKRTAEHHVSSILAKLGLSTRAEAIAYAVRHGTAPSPPPSPR